MGLMVNATPRPLYFWGDFLSIVQDAEWPQGRPGRVRKILPHTAFDTRTVLITLITYDEYRYLYDTLTVTYEYIVKGHFESNIHLHSNIHCFPNILFICKPVVLTTFTSTNLQQALNIS